MEHKKARRVLNYTVSYLSLEMENAKLFKNVPSNKFVSFLKEQSPNTSYFTNCREYKNAYKWCSYAYW